MRVLPEVFEEWLKHRIPKKDPGVPPAGSGVTRVSDRRMTVTAAAALLEMSSKQVRRLADNGVLNDNRPDASGWRWFDRGEVERYRQECLRRNGGG